MINYKKTAIKHALVFLGLSLFLYPTVLKSQKKFDLSKLSINTSYQFNIHAQYKQKEMQGEDILDYSFARSSEFGLGAAYTFNNSLIVQTRLSKTYYFSNLYFTQEYVNEIEKIESRFGFDYDSKYNYVQYYKLDISAGYSFVLSKKQHISMVAGLSIIHIIPHTSHQAIFFSDTTKYLESYLLMSYYNNSRYENGNINAYRSIDLGFHIALQYSIRIFRKLDLSFGLNASYIPREASKGYYKTWATSPIQASGVIVFPISHLGLSAGVHYYLR